MTETTTPTEGEVVDTSSADSALLDDDQTTNSAVDETDDTVAKQEDGADDSDSTTEENNKESDDDKSIAKFAKSQGFDPDNLTDGEKKALKIARDNQKALRSQMDARKPGEVENTIKGVDSKSDMSDREYLDFRMKQREMIDSVREFWMNNPDDKQYEKEAIAILAKEKEQFGEAAQMRLIENMPRLVREAKFAAGAFDTKKIEAKAQREERERLKKVQEGGADSLDATATTSSSGSSKDMDKWVKEDYDPTNAEHRKKLDTYLNSVLK